jgi:class 3 adenylate cyclase/tetratricopeptide (TPR) repeat protein
LRLVSVLFCDLVGFTPLSEASDPEEVRELLSGYFDLARAIVARYGGVVEKFIGDAVMAVWGVPVANEDDAERSVRAGLDLASAVAAYGAEYAPGGLEARIGIVTGTVATTETPEEGLVVGDRVNTAARIQAVAPPGRCYVDEATRRATEAAVVYADAGPHELKGKSEPVRLYEALRVIAGVGGALKSEGLEAPFVGRDRELRLVKDLFHASAEESRAHLVSVTGIAGIGKSRLAWEFYKYLDGLSSVFRWHRGRCLSYGEGVAHWALAEMVRGRAGILEGEDSASAAAKLRDCVEEHVADPEERLWIEPRLAHLIGLEDRVARDKEDLFAAWRLFFERMSEVYPVVMSFEDMQWADASLLDFIEYLLDWSRNHAIFVLTLARPDLVERRPSWGAGRRNFTSIYLEPLGEKGMRDLITGLVPGLPDEMSEQILARAEGVPLYAVETVRMLIDRGLLVREGSSYQPTGAIGELDIPETLHALIAARLDGLAPGERSLLQEAAVIGKSFSRASLLALTDLGAETLDELLGSLVRKEVLSLQTDPRSSERGQFGFLQDLVRAVAYETLPKRHRKERHLAVALYLQGAWGSEDEEIVEVVASHYLEAYELAPEADDAGEVKSKAREMLARAGERAAALAAGEEARRYFEQALELADDSDTRGALEERAGQMAWLAGHGELARSHFERAIATLDAAGRTHASARVTARLGEVDYFEERHHEAVDRMEHAFAVLSNDEIDADVVTLAAQLGRVYYFMGDVERASSRIEFALDLAERLDLAEPLSQALNTKATLLSSIGRKQESDAILRYALQLALDNGLSGAALRAYNNLITTLEYQDRYDEALAVAAAGLDLARRTGDTRWESGLLANTLAPLFLAGRWDELLQRIADIGQFEGLAIFSGDAGVAAVVHAHQGDLARARALVDATSTQASSPDLQNRIIYWCWLAGVLQAEGDPRQALVAAEAAIEAAEGLPPAFIGNKLALVEAIEGALDLGDDAKAAQLLERMERLRPGETTEFFLAQTARFRARIASMSDGAGVEGLFGEATGRFRRVGAAFWLAITLLEHGEWLVAQARVAEAGAVFGEAEEIFSRLRARPWLERVARAACR